MKPFYFTFGFGQPMKEVLDFVVIYAEDKSSARDEMVKNFNLRWAFCYNEDQWQCNGQTQQEKFNYRNPLIINNQ